MSNNNRNNYLYWPIDYLSTPVAAPLPAKIIQRTLNRLERKTLENYNFKVKTKRFWWDFLEHGPHDAKNEEIYAFFILEDWVNNYNQQKADVRKQTEERRLR